MLTYNTICVHASETQNKKSFFQKFPSKVNVFVTFVDKSHSNSFQKKISVPAVLAGCFFHFAQANWRKVQDLGLKGVYGQQMKVRTFDKVLRIIGPNSSRRPNYGLRSSMFGIAKFSRSQMLSEMLRRNLAWKSWSCWQKK